MGKLTSFKDLKIKPLKKKKNLILDHSSLIKNIGNKRLKKLLLQNGFSLRNSSLKKKKKNLIVRSSNTLIIYFRKFNEMLKKKHRGVEGALMSITRSLLLNTYKGARHKIGLPVRGQRTRSNRKTARFLKVFGYFLDTSFLYNYNFILLKKFNKKWRSNDESNLKHHKKLLYKSF